MDPHGVCLFALRLNSLGLRSIRVHQSTRKHESREDCGSHGSHRGTAADRTSEGSGRNAELFGARFMQYEGSFDDVQTCLVYCLVYNIQYYTVWYCVPK